MRNSIEAIRDRGSTCGTVLIEAKRAGGKADGEFVEIGAINSALARPIGGYPYHYACDPQGFAAPLLPLSMLYFMPCEEARGGCPIDRRRTT